MKTVALPQNEAARLHVLHSLALLDTPPSPELDNLSRLATRLFNVTVAGVSLVDADRQWFKSVIGLDCRETARRSGLCTQLLRRGQAFAVTDARSDPCFRDCPLVARPAGIVAYAACPLRSLGGHVLGAFFVADHRPRPFSDSEFELLASLAAYAELHLQKREVQCQVQALRQEVQADQLQLEQAFLQTAIGAGMATLSGRWLRVNPRLCQITGYSEAELLQFSRQDLIHPDDLAVAHAQQEALRAGCLYDYRMEKRLRHRKGHYVWVEVSVAAVRDATGTPQFLVLTVQDIDARKSMEGAGRQPAPLAQSA